MFRYLQPSTAPFQMKEARNEGAAFNMVALRQMDQGGG
jgi:hypothetical protein